MSNHLLKCLKCPEKIKKSLGSVSAQGELNRGSCSNIDVYEDADKENAGGGDNNNLGHDDTNIDMEIVDINIDTSLTSPSTSSFSTLSGVDVDAGGSTGNVKDINVMTGRKIIKHSRMEQSSIISFTDRISKKEQISANAAFARAIYAGALPLSIFPENPLWNIAFNILRPSYKPPNLHSLRKPLLEAEYARIMKLAEEKVQNSQCLTLISDGWTNIRGDIE
ncbi:uncharacterized protein LOC126742556 [Anthonomus grandis grandis]|uniref:uncharacterized protein LOC126742556 n=1 Tax=Anthonomus grandis grandis TaxID=2921223 RepID=UPI002166A394|nr:uncharacterized protein LOC126742556 [Anthonomus grandis grandis]